MAALRAPPRARLRRCTHGRPSPTEPGIRKRTLSDVRGGSLPFHRPDVHHVDVTRQKMPWCRAAVTAAVFSSLFLIGGIAHAQTTPTLTASPSTVAAGNVVTFTGTGFNPSQTITLSSSGTGTSIASTTSDTAGAFSVSWTVPAGTAAGTYTITAADQSGLTASTTLTVTSSSAFLSVSPTSVTAGQPVTFTGSGFNPSQTVTLMSSGAGTSI